MRAAPSKEWIYRKECPSWSQSMRSIMTLRFGRNQKSLIQRGKVSVKSLMCTKSSCTLKVRTFVGPAYKPKAHWSCGTDLINFTRRLFLSVKIGIFWTLEWEKIYGYEQEDTQSFHWEISCRSSLLMLLKRVNVSRDARISNMYVLSQETKNGI